MRRTQLKGVAARRKLAHPLINPLEDDRLEFAPDFQAGKLKAFAARLFSEQRLDSGNVLGTDLLFAARIGSRAHALAGFDQYSPLQACGRLAERRDVIRRD